MDPEDKGVSRTRGSPQSERDQLKSSAAGGGCRRQCGPGGVW